jgi:anti-anti-sigma factor
MSDFFNYETKRIGDIVIFKVAESRFDSKIAGLVKGELTILLNAEEVKKLIFDLSDVEYCDSSGLSAILLAFRMLHEEGGELRIAGARKNVRTLIEISQLDRVLKLSDSVEDAINELKGE